MLKKLIVIFALSILAGCASVPLESPETTEQAKQFNPPQAGNAGIYLYRPSVLGSAYKKDLWIDGKCIGASAAKVFFYTEVAGDKSYTISTESEFSPNSITLDAQSDTLYFVKQIVRPGLLIAGADLDIIDADIAMGDIYELDMAKQGECSRQILD